MYAEDFQCDIAILMHSFFVGVPLMFTCVESPVNSGARKDAWEDALRFEYIHTTATNSQ